MKILLSILTVFTIGMYASAQDVYTLDEKYSINSNGTIYLKSDDATVKIKGTDRKDVHVEVFRSVEEKGIQFGNRNFMVDVNEKGGNLYIEEHQESSMVTIIGYVREEYKITIEAPEGTSLMIKGDDDDYRITNINGKIVMDVDDGDADLRQCSGKHFEFDFDDGDITMDIASGYLKLDIDDSDFEVRNASFTEIDADADDGDIHISTSLTDGGSYNFSVDDGSIDLHILSGGGQFRVYHDDSSISASSDFVVEEDDENFTKYNLKNGTARIKVRTDDGRVRLN